SDVDASDVLTYTATGLPDGLAISADGKITGTPTSSASQGGPGSDGVYTVTVTADDGNGGTGAHTFTWTIVNPAPLAADDAYTVGEDSGSTTVGNALGNDSDPDGDTFAATVVTDGAGSNGGLFSIAADGTVTFDTDGAFEDLAVGES